MINPKNVISIEDLQEIILTKSVVKIEINEVFIPQKNSLDDSSFNSEELYAEQQKLFAQMLKGNVSNTAHNNSETSPVDFSAEVDKAYAEQQELLKQLIKKHEDKDKNNGSVEKPAAKK